MVAEKRMQQTIITVLHLYKCNVLHEQGTVVTSISSIIAKDFVEKPVATMTILKNEVRFRIVTKHFQSSTKMYKAAVKICRPVKNNEVLDCLYQYEALSYAVRTLSFWFSILIYFAKSQCN